MAKTQYSSRSADNTKALDIGILAAILVLSILLRVGVAFYLGDVVDAPPLLTDQRSYHALGARLIAGHGFSFDRGWYPFTPPETPTAHWSFLYSLFVAAVYGMFGVHPLAVRLVQAVLGGVLVPGMVYRLTQRVLQPADLLSHPRLPLVATLLAAVYAYFALYAATLMTETFFFVALLWSLERTLVFSQDPSWQNGATLGFVLGVSALIRQSILPWIIVAFAWLLVVAYQRGRLRQAIVGVLSSILIMALMIAPFTIRNYRVYGGFLLLNSNAGYAMYSAQHPMHGIDFQPFAAAPVPDELSGLNEAQLDRELMRRGIGFILADPGRYLLLSLSRVRVYFEFWPSPDTTLLHNVGRMVSFGLFLPLILAGLFLALRHARQIPWSPAQVQFSATPLALILLFAFSYSMLHILTWAMPRYRLPLDAATMPFAALALVSLASRLVVRRSVVTPRPSAQVL